MEVPKYATLLLFLANVTCGQGDQMQCSDHGASFTECSFKIANLKKYFDNTSVIPSFVCPDGYELTHADGTWLHACQPKSCPGKALEDPVECLTLTESLKMCPKIYLEAEHYKIDNKGNLDNLQHRFSVPLGDFFIKSTRAIICDPNRNRTAKPPNWAELPGWCMPFEVPKGGYVEKGGQLVVKELNVEVERFTLEDGENAIICTEIYPKIIESCENASGFLPGDEIEVLPKWTIRDTKPVLEKSIYHLGEYLLAENLSMVIVCTIPEESHSDVTFTHKYSVATSLISSAFLLLEYYIQL